MSHYPFGARATLRALTGLDIGLRVRVAVQPSQRAIFCGAENLSARQLISELAEEISGCACTATRCAGSSSRRPRRCN